MEDPNMEWEVQEYSPSEKGEVTRVRWILNKGLGLGKKVVITGIAISSAPLFVPPLVVFSAMGFAFSVPFGLVFASYACTDKVMSKLLPTPEPYPMIDSYTDEDEDDDYWQKDVEGYEEQPTLYTDENVEEEREEYVGEDIVEEQDDYMGEIQKEIELGGRYVEEQDYEDSGDNIERKDDLVARGVKGGEEEFIGNEVEVQQDAGNKEERIEDEEEEIVRESTGLLEKIGDARNIGDEVEEETRGPERMHQVGEGEVEKIISVGEPVDSFVDEDMLMNKPIEEVKGPGEKGRFVEETKMPFGEDDVTASKPEKVERTDVQTSNEDHNVSLEKVGETEDTVIGNGNNIHDLNGTANVQVIGQNVDRTPVVAKKVEVKKGRAVDNTSTGVPEDVAAKMTLEYRDADIREISDESGLHLYDNRNIASKQKSDTASQSLDVDDNLKEGTVDVDYMALPTSVRVSESKKVKRGAKKKAVRSEVLLKEEKMWERINALRAIVGYTAAPKTACVEEVKALYIFTGVEPPFSFKDPSDLADINEKLRFLMSIVGVK